MTHRNTLGTHEEYASTASSTQLILTPSVTHSPYESLKEEEEVEAVEVVVVAAVVESERRRRV